MDAPPIQYARTSDGVSIAYWTLGEGPPLVEASTFPIALRLRWQIPELQAWYERLSKHHTVVAYDRVWETGREPLAASSEVAPGVLALETMVDVAISHTGADSVALLAGWAQVASVAAYAGQHPGRISRTILTSSLIAVEEADSPTQRMRLLMGQGDWVTFTEQLIMLRTGMLASRARELASLWRESMSEEWYRVMMAAPGTSLSVSPAIAMPVLVLVRAEAYPGAEHAHRIASRIPDARLRYSLAMSSCFGLATSRHP